jgi:hypothetical protein
MALALAIDSVPQIAMPAFEQNGEETVFFCSEASVIKSR